VNRGKNRSRNLLPEVPDRIRADDHHTGIPPTIDIITTGARSGLKRTTEIWLTNVSGRIIICGTPAAEEGRGPLDRRDWLANLIAHPEFVFCLKESVEVRLSARGSVVADPQERRELMTAPQMKWYRDQVDSVEVLIDQSPIVDVRFTGEFAWLSS